MLGRKSQRFLPVCGNDKRYIRKLISNDPIRNGDEYEIDYIIKDIPTGSIFSTYPSSVYTMVSTCLGWSAHTWNQYTPELAFTMVSMCLRSTNIQLSTFLWSVHT